jgi:hypothetical protein
MAQQESPREDLFREATALVERIELAPHVESSRQSASLKTSWPIVAGFRAGGGLSIFFGDDPAYHFNAAGELRRAYVDGLLYKALNRELVSLARIRTAEQVELRSHTLSTSEQTSFVQHVSTRLVDLNADLAAELITVNAQVPPDANVLVRLRAWLANHVHLKVASRPNA